MILIRIYKEPDSIIRPTFTNTAYFRGTSAAQVWHNYIGFCDAKLKAKKESIHG